MEIDCRPITVAVRPQRIAEIVSSRRGRILRRDQIKQPAQNSRAATTATPRLVRQRNSGDDYSRVRINRDRRRNRPREGTRRQKRRLANSSGTVRPEPGQVCRPPIGTQPESLALAPSGSHSCTSSSCLRVPRAPFHGRGPQHQREFGDEIAPLSGTCRQLEKPLGQSRQLPRRQFDKGGERQLGFPLKWRSHKSRGLGAGHRGVDVAFQNGQPRKAEAAPPAQGGQAFGGCHA